MIAVLKCWLEMDVDKSWNKLANAVEMCSHQVLAKLIRDQYARLPLEQQESNDLGNVTK